MIGKHAVNRDEYIKYRLNMQGCLAAETGKLR